MPWPCIDTARAQPAAGSVLYTDSQSRLRIRTIPSVSCLQYASMALRRLLRSRAENPPSAGPALYEVRDAKSVDILISPTG